MQVLFSDVPRGANFSLRTMPPKMYMKIQENELGNAARLSVCPSEAEHGGNIEHFIEDTKVYWTPLFESHCEVTSHSEGDLNSLWIDLGGEG